MDDSDALAVLETASDPKAKPPTAHARHTWASWFCTSADGTSFANLVSWLRWVIPVIMGLIGGGYMFLEEVVLEGHSISSDHVIRSIFVIGVVGPIVPWLLLRWAAKLAVEEARAQRELALRNQELGALNAVAKATGQSLNLDRVLYSALEKTVKLVGMDAGEIRLLAGEQLILTAHHGMSEPLKGEKSVPIGECVCGRCARTRQSFSFGSVPAEPSLAQSLCSREGFQALVTIPIQNKAQVLGVMLLASRQATPNDLPDQGVLSAVAQRLAAAVENARLYQQANRRALHLQTASLVGQRMITLMELNPLLNEVVTMIKEKFGHDHVRVFLVDEGAGEIVLKEASGVAADRVKARGLRFKIGKEGISGWVAHSGQAIVCNDVSREPRYHAVEEFSKTRSELAVPLRVGNRIVGVLDVLSDQRDAFDKEDVTILQILGNQTGIAIRNAQLYQETKQRYEAMIALHEVSLDMIAQLDTTQLLQSLLRRGAQLLGAEGGTLFLYDERQKVVRNVASYNTWKDFVGMTLRLGEGLVGRVIQTGQPMIENNYENWGGRSVAFAGTPQSRIASAPLRWKDKTIGGINILNDAQGRPFDEKDLWLLSHFADLASIAVQNAELHGQVKEFGQSLELKVEERTGELSRAKDAIEFQARELRSLLAKTIDVQEQERARIAREMHDGVIQLISAARFELQTAKAAAQAGWTATANEKMDATRQVLVEMEKEIRRSIYGLHPPILDVVGVGPVLKEYVHNYQELLGIACEMELKGMPYRLPAEIELSVFRLVEEALQNVAAHAEARTARVTMDYQPHLLCVSVQDDGQGFDYKQWIASRDANHLGLLGMRERIGNLGGEMRVHSNVGRGTEIMFELPVVQDEVEGRI